eukprot:Phypoly_transcript_15770.p1 GENE.Phypoly_transcript_15770~~Phypoly_transcript_15770.p1  ORF type:complete len:301 (+),score=35.82 Phypoly_transcript_15770:30-905(+)
MALTLTRCTRLNTCILPLGFNPHLVIRRSFWKLNKQTLKAPPPLEEETSQSQVQPTQNEPAQPSTQTQSTTHSIQTPQPVQSKTKQPPNKNIPYQPKSPTSNRIASLHIPQDGLVYAHDQKWFFRLFGAGVVAQFGAWVFFLDIVGHNPRISYSLSFPVFGGIIGCVFAFFARELSTHNVRELKLFPGGRAIEIVTYTLFGFRKSEILAIDQIVKPKQPFSYEEWKIKPSPLKFAVLGDKTQYFISFQGNFIEPKCIDYILNGGDMKYVKSDIKSVKIENKKKKKKKITYK